jgi:hypothetical protein
MGLGLQPGQPESLSGQTDPACMNAPNRRSRCAHWFRVLGLTCTIAFAVLWIVSLFCFEGVVWEWSDGFCAIDFWPGTFGVHSNYIPQECLSMEAEKQIADAKGDAEALRGIIRERAQSIRSDYAGDTRIRSPWSLDRFCCKRLPSYTSRDEYGSSSIYLRDNQLLIPFWTPVLLIAVPTLWSFCRVRAREKHGHRGECQHDLTGNVNGK